MSDAKNDSDESDETKWIDGRLREINAKGMLPSTDFLNRCSEIGVRALRRREILLLIATALEAPQNKHADVHDLANAAGISLDDAEFALCFESGVLTKFADKGTRTSGFAAKSVLSPIAEMSNVQAPFTIAAARVIQAAPLAQRPNSADPNMSCVTAWLTKVSKRVGHDLSPYYNDARNKLSELLGE